MWCWADVAGLPRGSESWLDPSSRLDLPGALQGSNFAPGASSPPQGQQASLDMPSHGGGSVTEGLWRPSLETLAVGAWRRGLRSGISIWGVLII